MTNSLSLCVDCLSASFHHQSLPLSTDPYLVTLAALFHRAILSMLPFSRLILCGGNVQSYLLNIHIGSAYNFPYLESLEQCMKVLTIGILIRGYLSSITLKRAIHTTFNIVFNFTNSLYQSTLLEQKLCFLMEVWPWFTIGDLQSCLHSTLHLPSGSLTNLNYDIQCPLATITHRNPLAFRFGTLRTTSRSRLPLLYPRKFSFVLCAGAAPCVGIPT